MNGCACMGYRVVQTHQTLASSGGTVPKSGYLLANMVMPLPYPVTMLPDTAFALPELASGLPS